MTRPLILATRGSPLALCQAELTAKRLAACLPGHPVEILKITTTGDRKTRWSLESQGGKGLFTKELEEALLEGRAHIAVHSAKDLPTNTPEGLTLAAFLPREDPHDVLVVREDVAVPRHIATGSPRRRTQLKALFPQAVWSEIRGNVHTRMKKVVGGHEAEATVLAAAGLRRLGITGWPGLTFKPIDFSQVVPAVGQGAVALQTTLEMASLIATADDAETRRAVTLERRLLTALGGGCHHATAVFVCGRTLRIFHETTGYQEHQLPLEDEEAMVESLGASLLSASKPRSGES